MTLENRDLHQVLRHLVQSARILPDRETGRTIVILDTSTYMNIEDYVSSLERKESPNDNLPVDVLLGEPIQ